MVPVYTEAEASWMQNEIFLPELMVVLELTRIVTNKLFFEDRVQFWR